MYLVERQFEVREEDMPAIGRRSRSLIEGQFPEITWVRSHVTLDERGMTGWLHAWPGAGYG